MSAAKAGPPVTSNVMSSGACSAIAERRESMRSTVLSLSPFVLTERVVMAASPSSDGVTGEGCCEPGATDVARLSSSDRSAGESCSPPFVATRITGASSLPGKDSSCSATTADSALEG